MKEKKKLNLDCFFHFDRACCRTSTVMAPIRAYVASDVPLKGRSEVIVTNAVNGPAKFSIRLKKSNWEYQRMRSELESTALHSLQVTPDKGTPCIAVKSEVFYPFSVSITV